MADDPVLTPRTVRVPLYRDADLDTIAALAGQLATAKRRAENGTASTLLLGEIDDVTRITEEHDAAVAVADEHATWVDLQALPRRRWKDLVAEHPPRDGNLTDAKAGVNEATFSEAIVPLSITKPTFSSDTAKAAFVDSLEDARFEKLYLAAFHLNRGLRADPKALLR